MQWVIWDEELKGPSSIMRELPANLQGEGIARLNELGYRQLYTIQPEDYIPRFSNLLGSATFELRADGHVYQSYPNADFSLAAVRKILKEMAAVDAGRVLQGTDWYVVRKLEIGTPIPEDISGFRQKVRDHLDWIREDIDKQGARELVEYRWIYPSTNDQIMINGTPVNFRGTALNTPPADSATQNLDNSSVIPLMRNAEQVPLPYEEPPSTVPTNDVDIHVPTAEEMFPYLSDPAPVVDNALAADAIVESRGAPLVPPGDIRTMNEEQRRALDPEVRARLEAEDLERMRREREEREKNA